MSVERITVLLEQLQDTINEQDRLMLLELEPSQDEIDGLVELARSCRDSAQALGSPSLSAEYTRLLKQLRELPVDTEGLDLAPEEPPVERSRDGKRVRFSDVQEEFGPEPERYRDEPNEIVEPSPPLENASEQPQQSLQTHFDHNETLMMEQDLRLESLGQSVSRTRQLGTEVNVELDTQLEVLGDLEAQTDRTQSRLSSATGGVETFNRKAREGGSCMIITVLVLILFILLVFL